MIKLENISKTYKVARREKGFKNAVKSLVKKEYKEILALDKISFEINEGEIVGYIGPNGAGKSSTVKVMSGILTPDSGTCVINGITPWKNRKEYVKNIGVVFGQRSQLWWDVPVIDSFELIKDIYDIDSNEYKNTLDELTQLLNLENLLKTPTRQLSLGQRMRCEISAAFLHRPKILFLDEPTIGLDAVSKIAVRDFIKTLNETRKTTIILTTHDMQDIEALAKRVVLIGKGKILLDSSLEKLKSEVSNEKIVNITYSKGEFSGMEGVKLLEKRDNKLKFDVNQNVIKVSKFIEKLSKDLEIEDISLSEISAEELVVKLYKDYDIG